MPMMTYDLLLSIFQPSSPLHDGAVIVQDDRVAAAACFLPLTVNPKLSKELGSRHRAAIGLTEENDSVAVVVSEETGIISLVVDGQIERGLDADALRARLRSLVCSRRPQGAGARASSRVTRRPDELVSLAVPACRPQGRCRSALAVLLWMVVAGEETVERGLRVPLELQQFPAGLELQGERADARRCPRARGSGDAQPGVGPATSSRCSICTRRGRGAGCSS